MAKILVVDDEPDILNVITMALEHVGHSVVAAEDGQAGVEMAKKEIPDLIVTDVRMPEMDGYELCQAIRATPELKHIPVLLLSVRGADAIRLGFEAGASDYMIKPFSIQELTHRVAHLLHRTIL
jgi:two-component system alkaline phosphatase synthesis response regulator PhoP